MTDAEAVLVRGLVKRYGHRAVVDGLSFSIAAGEVLAILGPNGAGKTTTVEIVEGYRSADAGDVEVLGRDPANADSEHRARVGLMLQAGGIEPRATAREVLRLHAAFFTAPRDPDELLRIVDLEAVAADRYRTLSGGERQRLGLALALVGRPDVLVLDEPTAGMDPAAKARTRELIAEQRDAGCAVLLTTHDLADVERLADRVVVIDRGRVVAEGAPADLATGPGQRIRFRVASALSDADLADLRRDLGATIDAGPPLYEIAEPAPTPQLVAALVAWLAERDILVVELRAGGGTLEERYLEIVSQAEER